MKYGRKIVALCTARIYDPQVHGFIERFNDLLSSNNISLFIYAINTAVYWKEDEVSAEAYVYDLIPYDIVDCVVCMDEKIKSRRIIERIIGRAAEHSVPVVVIDGKYEGTVPVFFDYEAGFEKIVRHVIEYHGARRPHFMAGIKGNAFSEARFKIFKKVIAENGIPYDDSMLSYGDYWAEPARKAAQEICSREVLPDAIICANDIMAINVSQVLQDNGISVPSQVMVTGFDGYREVRFVEPHISTMNCRSEVIADAAAELIISGRFEENIGRAYYVEPQEQFDESCGCRCENCGSGNVLDMFNDKFYRYHDDIRVFHDIMTKIQMSDTYEQAISHISRKHMHDMCCIVDGSCFHREVYCFSEPASEMKLDELFMIYDSDDESAGIAPFDMNDIIPSLEERLAVGHPLIFNILDFMDRPIGYVCFSFKDYNITDYSKTSKISSAISMGLGGYINRRYQKYLSDKLEEMYKNDSLTGLYNRAAFNLSLAEVRNDPQNLGKPVHIFMSDLDGLKFINDTFGHDAGDIAISTAAAALRNSCPPGSLLLRYGGDEMIALVIGDCEESAVIARIEDYLKNFNSHSALPYKIAASCGSYRTVLSEHFEFESAVKLADKAMYKIKKARKEAKG